MPIVNCKEGAPGPEINLLELRLDNVKDYRNTVFIVISDHALVSVGCISDNDTVLLASKLGRIVILPELYDLLLLHLHVLFSLTHRHLHASVLDDVVRSQIFLFFFSLGCLCCLLLLCGHLFLNCRLRILRTR